MAEEVIQTKEEVIGTSNIEPQVVKTTTTKVVPQVVGESPQKVFQKKKMIFQFNQVIWYITGIIEVLLLFRFFLKIISTNSSGFSNFIYTLSDVFVIPFKGIVAPSISGTSIFEWATLIAMIVIIVIALGILYLIDLIRPVTPEQISDNE